MGFTGDLQVGESIVGYGGYNSKTVLDRNLGNSIKYTVDKVRVSPEGYKGEVLINFSSKLLAKIPYLKEIKATKGSTRYLQLSLTDGIIFEGITNEDMANNNKKVAEIIEEVYEAKAAALRKPSAWRNYYEIIHIAGEKLAGMDLGNKYIYNPTTKLMELFVNSPKQMELQKNFGELVVDKGIDFGYAITIHNVSGSNI